MTAPAQLRQRVREAMACGSFARARDLCDLALNHHPAADEADALRSLRTEADRELTRGAAPPTLNRPAPRTFWRGAEAQGRGRFTEAVALLREAVEEDPSCPEAHAHLGMSLIGAGQFAEGFREYEWRTRLAWAAPRRMAAPVWNGRRMAGRTLVIWDEQGHGDAIQFFRFVVPAAAASAARLVFHGRPRLARLFGSQPALALSIPRTRDFPRPDAHASLMSLPFIMGLANPASSGGRPYLFAEPALVEAWRERLASIPGPRIGLVWQGNPDYVHDTGRSMPLAELVPLLDAFRSDASFVSLQKGAGEDQIANLPDRAVLHVLRPPLDAGDDGFVDTAAVMASLDLVITSDTSIAHLAGALGRPVWILLGNGPDWRWGQTGETTPFYPGARLFRRPEGRGWDQVVGQVSAALAARLAAPGRDP